MKNILIYDGNGEGRLAASVEKGLDCLRNCSKEYKIRSLDMRLSVLIYVMKKSEQVPIEECERLEEEYEKLRKPLEKRGLVPFRFPKSPGDMDLILGKLHRREL